LFERREKRIHPLRDDKILTHWNGLASAAFSRAAGALYSDGYIETARKAADFIYWKTGCKQLTSFLSPTKLYFKTTDDVKQRPDGIAEYTHDKTTIGIIPAAYICRNFSFYLPVTDPDEMLRLLK
jgi:uncharacterized protein YyaL (SSP411 family)